MVRCGLPASSYSIQVVHKLNGVFAEGGRISADRTRAEGEVMGCTIRSTMIMSVDGTSLGHTDSTGVVYVFCILVFLPEVFAPIFCELLNDYKYGASDSIYRLIIKRPS